MCGVIIGETESVEVSNLGILVRSMHCAAHDGYTLAAASSIIPGVKLSLFWTNFHYDLREMILNAKSNNC
jgi:hypothetical protein